MKKLDVDNLVRSVMRYTLEWVDWYCGDRERSAKKKYKAAKSFRRRITRAFVDLCAAQDWNDEPAHAEVTLPSEH